MKKVIIWLAVFGLLAASGAGVLTAADFDGDSRDDLAIFRPSSGMWAIRGVTRAYFGTSGDQVLAGDYTGDGIADIAIFRSGAGMWAIRGVTRTYFGGAGDTAIQGGGGQRIYDYVVRPGDGADLVQALQSDEYGSVFIPNGDYSVSEVIDIDNVDLVQGESNNAVIAFTGDGYYVHVTSPQCRLDNFRVTAGGDSVAGRGSVYIDADNVSLSNLRSVTSYDDGFKCSNSADYVSFVNCVARTAAGTGFSGNVSDYLSSYTNCMAKNCDYGFASCRNVSSCVVDGDGTTQTGFSGCFNISACTVLDCTATGIGLCSRISGCTVDLNGLGTYGFGISTNISSCHVEDTTSTEYYSCGAVDSESCD